MVPSTPNPAPRQATAEERYALRQHFGRLCTVRSPSGSERACADLVTDRLRGLGLAVTEDDAGVALGGTAGNLLCRIPGTDSAAGTIVLCAHLDTVPVGDVIRPQVRDGVWVDAEGGVLGADNKATVAVLLTLAERLVREPTAVTVELLLTVQEEPQLRGIQEFDLDRLDASCGYVVDHPSPIGGVVTTAPGHVRFDAHYRGRAAHAAIAPGDGRSAILAAARAIGALPAGRLPNGATVNVGHIDGGLAPGGAPLTNIVPPYARVLGEVRALDAVELQTTVDTVEAVLHDAAHDAAGPVDVDLVLETRFAPYAHARSAVPVRHAVAALEQLGIAPRPFADAGGSDANVLNAHGVPTVNLAGGNVGAHEPGESITEAALNTTLDLLLTIVDGHGHRAGPDGPHAA